MKKGLYCNKVFFVVVSFYSTSLIGVPPDFLKPRENAAFYDRRRDCEASNHSQENENNFVIQEQCNHQWYEDQNDDEIIPEEDLAAVLKKAAQAEKYWSHPKISADTELRQREKDASSWRKRAQFYRMLAEEKKWNSDKQANLEKAADVCDRIVLLAEEAEEQQNFCLPQVRGQQKQVTVLKSEMMMEDLARKQKGSFLFETESKCKEIGDTKLHVNSTSLIGDMVKVLRSLLCYATFYSIIGKHLAHLPVPAMRSSTMSLFRAGIMAFLLTQRTYASLSDGLVASYLCQGNMNDSSGNGNHVTPHNIGFGADSCIFNGVSSYGVVPNGNPFNFDSDFSISTKIKPGSSQVNYATFISKSVGLAGGFSVEQNGAANNQFNLLYVPGPYRSPPIQLISNNWNDLAFTKKGLTRIFHHGQKNRNKILC